MWGLVCAPSRCTRSRFDFAVRLHLHYERITDWAHLYADGRWANCVMGVVNAGLGNVVTGNLGYARATGPRDGVSVGPCLRAGSHCTRSGCVCHAVRFLLYYDGKDVAVAL